MYHCSPFLPKSTLGIFMLIIAALCVPAAHAGFLDDVKSAVNTANQVKSSVDTASKHLTSADDDALPGGVSSRLKSANKELDKAEKALSKGVGTPQDRAKRAQSYLKRANSYRQEIDKRYAGKFSPKNPEVVATDRRLAQVDQQIQEALAGQTAATPELQASPPSDSGQAALPSGAKYRLDKLDKELANVDQVLAKNLSADWRAKQAAMHLEYAQGYLDQIASGYPQAMGHAEVVQARQNLEQAKQKVQALEQQVAGDQTRKDAAAAGAKDAEALNGQWVEKLKPFTESYSGKLLATYATDDANLWAGWEAIHAELAPLWRQYQQTDFSGGKSMELQSLEKQLSRYLANYDSNHAIYAKNRAEAQADMGGFVFAKEPIDPAGPGGQTTSFQAGDHIYALARLTKPLSEIYGDKNKAAVRIDVKIDGKNIHAQFVEIKNPQYLERKYLVFEIAPKQITAYSDPDIVYGKTTATLRQGPMEMLDKLGKLAPGKHTVDFVIAYYGKTYAQGGFDIQGSDFAAYQDMAEQASQAAADSVVLPPARMTNKGLEAQMRKLAEDAGWPEIYRLNIIDKDWWIDRVRGGNSAVKSRHMAAAVMAKDGQGYYYKVCTFHQPRLITGGWGAMELSRTGDRVPVQEDNKDK